MKCYCDGGFKGPPNSSSDNVAKCQACDVHYICKKCATVRPLKKDSKFVCHTCKIQTLVNCQGDLGKTIMGRPHPTPSPFRENYSFNNLSRMGDGFEAIFISWLQQNGFLGFQPLRDISGPSFLRSWEQKVIVYKDLVSAFYTAYERATFRKACPNRRDKSILVM